MRRIIAFALALLMMGVLCCGCDRPEPVSQADPETNGVLRISTSPDFAPMVFVDPTKSGQDQFVGFDITLAKFIADELNMELEIMPMDFNSCQMAVYAGTVDMSTLVMHGRQSGLRNTISPITITLATTQTVR